MNAKREHFNPIGHDPEASPEVTDEWIFATGSHQDETLVRRGRPKLANPRQLLTLRLPPGVIACWRSTGPGWQTRMVEVLEKSAPRLQRVVG